MFKIFKKIVPGSLSRDKKKREMDWTVPISNEMIIVDMDGKELKGFEIVNKKLKKQKYLD